MARRGRGTAVLKRQREVKKAERAAAKREKRETRKLDEGGERSDTPTPEELEAYGFIPAPPDDEETGA